MSLRTWVASAEKQELQEFIQWIRRFQELLQTAQQRSGTSTQNPCNQRECKKSNITSFYLCGKCLNVVYCSKECQIRDFEEHQISTCGPQQPKPYSQFAAANKQLQEEVQKIALQRLVHPERKQFPSATPSRGHLKRKASSSSSSLAATSSRTDSGPLKKRMTFTKLQKAVLDDWFDEHRKNPYPSAEEKKRLSQQLNVDVTSIQYFFVNKRARAKQKDIIAAAQPPKKKRKKVKTKKSQQ